MEFNISVILLPSFYENIPNGSRGISLAKVPEVERAKARGLLNHPEIKAMHTEFVFTINRKLEEIQESLAVESARCQP